MRWFRWRAGKPANAWPRIMRRLDADEIYLTALEGHRQGGVRVSNTSVEMFADSDALVAAAGERLVDVIEAADRRPRAGADRADRRRQRHRL